MKIGIDVRPMLGEPAGIGHYVKGLLSGFERVGDDHEFYLYANQNFESRVPKKENFHKIIFLKNPLFWHLAVYVDILKRKLDLYHSSHSLIIPSLPFVDCVVTYHDASSVIFAKKHSLKVRLVAKFLFKLAGLKARYVIVPSEATRRDVLKLTGIEAKKIIRIPEGGGDLQGIWEKDTKTPYILFLGTLEPRKNIDNLIYAYKILVSEYRREEKLKIAGKKGWLYDHLFRLVGENNLEGKVEFLGYVSEEEKARLFKGAAAFVFPSLYEGFGLPVLEAMRFGVPVVTSNISSLPEVAGSSALLVNPNDPEALAFNINRLLTDTDLARSLSTAGKKRAKSFSWEKTAKETLKVYALK